MNPRSIPVLLLGISMVCRVDSCATYDVCRDYNLLLGHYEHMREFFHAWVSEAAKLPAQRALTEQKKMQGMIDELDRQGALEVLQLKQNLCETLSRVPHKQPAGKGMSPDEIIDYLMNL